MQPDQIATLVLEQIKRAYAFFESLNISVTSLLVITIVLALVFLFAVREAASWFFKVDSLKKEVRQLRKSTEKIETQISQLQALMVEAKQISLGTALPELPAELAPKTVSTFPPEPKLKSAAEDSATAKSADGRQFPITR